jgi:transposase
MKNEQILNEIIAEKDARIAELEAHIKQYEGQNRDEKDARITELEALVKYYQEQLKLSAIRQFCPKNEKYVNVNQIQLFDAVEVVTDICEPEPVLEEITYTRRKQSGKRDIELSGLPVEVEEHTLPEDERVCPECGGAMHEMGHDISRDLKIVPAQVKVLEHRRSVYSCRHCEKHNDHVPVIKAQIPEPVIRGSLASPSAVAYIMTQKYVMYAPLYRQEQDWKRQGVTLSRQTMANWVIRCSEDWLEPLYDRMHGLLIERQILHADETTIQVLHEPGKPATSKSYMWLYRSSGDASEHIVLFNYQSSRASYHPKTFLSGFKGLLHTDGYAGYHNLPVDITVVGCWVHMRRRFEDALKVIPPPDRDGSSANRALLRIGKLFCLEDQWKNLTAEKRHECRLEYSKPLADEFFNWLRSLSILPKSAMGKAVNYALEQQPWLMNVYLDGRTEISNNRAENAVRPFAVGRRNWLFSNSMQGAKASAIVYTMIETAKANGLKPFEYLEFLLKSIPNTTTGNLEKYLPWGESVPEYCRMMITKMITRESA